MMLNVAVSVFVALTDEQVIGYVPAGMGGVAYLTPKSRLLIANRPDASAIEIVSDVEWSPLNAQNRQL